MTRTASSWLMMMWRRYKLHSHLIGKRRRRTESRSIRLGRRWRWRRSGFRAEANSTLTQICSGNSLLLHFVLSPRFDMAKKPEISTDLTSTKEYMKKPRCETRMNFRVANCTSLMPGQFFNPIIKGFRYPKLRLILRKNYLKLITLPKLSGKKGTTLLKNIKHKFRGILQPFTYQNVGQCWRVKKTAASKTHLDNDLVC